MAAEADELPGDLLSAMRAENDHRVPRHQVHAEQLLGRGAHDDGLAVQTHVEDHDRRFGREGTGAGASTDARVVGLGGAGTDEQIEPLVLQPCAESVALVGVCLDEKHRATGSVRVLHRSIASRTGTCLAGAISLLTTGTFGPAG